MEALPSKKTFVKEYKKNGKVFFTLTWEQATIKEYFDFENRDTEGKKENLYEIIKSGIKRPHSFNLRGILKRNDIDYYIKYINDKTIYKEIISTRFRVPKSIYTREDDKKPSKGLFRHTFGYICTFYNIRLDDLLEKYTLEQFAWLLDGYIWAQNENAGKKGQARNKKALFDPEQNALELDEIHNIFTKHGL